MRWRASEREMVSCGVPCFHSDRRGSTFHVCCEVGAAKKSGRVWMFGPRASVDIVRERDDRFSESCSK